MMVGQAGDRHPHSKREKQERRRDSESQVHIQEGILPQTSRSENNPLWLDGLPFGLTGAMVLTLRLCRVGVVSPLLWAASLTQLC